ncbi:MAG: hypothetical protein HUU29_04655 [Planctomycetaceae bacterium]|nr:hypothetical protein [Planctomycetaceae bacterium]
MLALVSCAIPNGARVTLDTPETAVRHMESAFAGDDVDAFLFTLSEETLAKYETKILVAWEDVREMFYFRDVKVTGEEAYKPEYENPGATSDYVFPKRGKPARKVRARIEVDGKHYDEDFLFVQEIDPPRDNTMDSPYIRVRDETIPRHEHPTPDRYATEREDARSRTHWRLIYPYYPFQSRSKLARDLMNKLGGEER